MARNAYGLGTRAPITSAARMGASNFGRAGINNRVGSGLNTTSFNGANLSNRSLNVNRTNFVNNNVNSNRFNNGSLRPRRYSAGDLATTVLASAAASVMVALGGAILGMAATASGTG